MKYESRLSRLERALPVGDEVKLAPLQLTDLVYLAEAEERAVEEGDESIARTFRNELRRKLRRRWREGFHDYGELPTGEFRQELYAIRDYLAATEAADRAAT